MLFIRANSSRNISRDAIGKEYDVNVNDNVDKQREYFSSSFKNRGGSNSRRLLISPRATRRRIEIQTRPIRGGRKERRKEGGKSNFDVVLRKTSIVEVEEENWTGDE